MLKGETLSRSSEDQSHEQQLDINFRFNLSVDFPAKFEPHPSTGFRPSTGASCGRSGVSS